MCSATARRRYLDNVSGPLIDRIDIRIRTSASGAVVGARGEPSAVVAERVAAARERSQARWGRVNSRIPGPILRRDYPASAEGMALVASLLAEGALTQRGVDRTLRLAWTLADLGGADQPGIDHVFRATGLHETGELSQEAA